jgi:hypothetical protein
MWGAKLVCEEGRGGGGGAEWSAVEWDSAAARRGRRGDTEWRPHARARIKSERQRPGEWESEREGAGGGRRGEAPPRQAAFHWDASFQTWLPAGATLPAPRPPDRPLPRGSPRPAPQPPNARKPGARGAEGRAGMCACA